jgi:SAM-dependent methyltransferase
MNTEARRQWILQTIAEQQLLTPERAQKWHGQTLRYVQFLVRDFGFDQKRVLDIGCHLGNSLLYWGPGSEGVDVTTEVQQFLAAFDIRVYLLNVENGFDAIATRYDAIYTNNLIEHLVAPHLFLVRLHALLQPGGLLALGHPLTPDRPFGRLWQRMGRNGWLASEHINFFSPAAARLMVERAGFRVLRQYLSPFERTGLDRLPLIRAICEQAATQVLTVCQKIDGYRYPAKRAAAFDPAWAADCQELRGNDCLPNASDKCI